MKLYEIQLVSNEGCQFKYMYVVATEILEAAEIFRGVELGEYSLSCITVRNGEVFVSDDI